jgi:hypothetical protein
MIAVAWLLLAYKIGGCHAVESDRDVSGDRGIMACVIVSGYDRLRRAQVRSGRLTIRQGNTRPSQPKKINRSSPFTAIQPPATAVPKTVC